MSALLAGGSRVRDLGVSRSASYFPIPSRGMWLFATATSSFVVRWNLR